MVRSPTAATANHICRRRRFGLGAFVEAKIWWREGAGRRKRSSYSFITIVTSRRWDAVGEDAPLDRRSSEPEADKSLGKFWRRGSPVRAADRRPSVPSRPHSVLHGRLERSSASRREKI